jgi:hypothetical protein
MGISEDYVEYVERRRKMEIDHSCRFGMLERRER